MNPSESSETQKLRLQAELDRVDGTVSPAQPTGPNRIDDDNAPPAPPEPQQPAHVKPDHSGRMEN